MADRTCEHCGAIYKPKRDDPRYRFCSGDCRRANTRALKDQRRHARCMECTGPIIGRRRNARFCTVRCNSRYRQRERRRLERSMRTPRNCEYCGQIIAPTAHQSARFCSARCRNRWHHLTKQYGPNGPALGRRIDAGMECQNVGCHRPAESIDHCHRMQWNRWLLCQRCNTILGLLEEDSEQAMGIVLLLKEQANWKRTPELVERMKSGDLISGR